jgi:hypothetical protein
MAAKTQNKALIKRYAFIMIPFWRVKKVPLTPTLMRKENVMSIFASQELAVTPGSSLSGKKAYCTKLNKLILME